MIKVIHYQNASTEKPLEAIISESYDEVRKLLPKLPSKIQIYFSDYGIIPESGVGASHIVMTLLLFQLILILKIKRSSLKIFVQQFSMSPFIFPRIILATVDLFRQ